MDFNCLLASILKFLGSMALVFHSKSLHGNNEVSMRLELLVFEEDGAYIAYSPALDISAFGDTEDLAKEEFAKTLKSYLEYCMSKNTFFDDLRAHGWEVKSRKRIKAPSRQYLMESNDTYKDIRANKSYKTFNKEIAIPAL